MEVDSPGAGIILFSWIVHIRVVSLIFLYFALQSFKQSHPSSLTLPDITMSCSLAFTEKIL